MVLLLRFNRTQISLLVAAVVLALGALSPWASLPPETLETFAVDLSWAIAGRVLAAIFAILSLMVAFRSQFSFWLRLTFGLGLIGTLLFPYLITTRSPSGIFLAQDYQSQLNRVTGNIELNFDLVQAKWKEDILLDQGIPTDSILPIKIHDSHFLEISSWNSWVDLLGYNNTFFNFIGGKFKDGWTMAVIGFVIELIGLYFNVKKAKLIPEICLFIGIFLSLQLSILSQGFMINKEINELDRNLMEGQYKKICDHGHFLEINYPLLQGDTLFNKTLGQAYFYNKKTEPILLNFSRGLEFYDRGNLEEAEDYFQKVLALDSQNFLARGYLATTILNQGIGAFNNQKTEEAADDFAQVLQIFPNHLEALYALMLASTINSDYEKSGFAAQQILDNQKYFQKVFTLSLLGQAYLHSAWSSYHKGEDVKAWEQYRKSVDTRAWK